MTVERELPDPQRLRRHLRALSAVNRQLREQLDANAGGAAWTSGRVRRASVGSRWLKELQRDRADRDAFLVHAPTRGVFVVEGPVRREVTSGLLSAALSRALGPVRAVADDDVDGWREGPPVAVLEAGTGRPFVVVGGKRLPLRGLPLPYPVTDDEMLALPVGTELHLAVGIRSGAGQVERTRALVEHEGPLRAGAVLFNKVTRRLRRIGSGTK